MSLAGLGLFSFHSSLSVTSQVNQWAFQFPGVLAVAPVSHQLITHAIFKDRHKPPHRQIVASLVVVMRLSSVFSQLLAPWNALPCSLVSLLVNKQVWRQMETPESRCILQTQLTCTWASRHLPRKKIPTSFKPACPLSPLTFKLYLDFFGLQPGKDRQTRKRTKIQNDLKL